MCVHRKKRDCNLAVPRIEALALPFYLNKQHRAHAACIYTRIHAYLIVIHTNEHPCAAMFWIKVRICEIPIRQNKARKTPFTMSFCLTSVSDDY